MAQVHWQREKMAGSQQAAAAVGTSVVATAARERKKDVESCMMVGSRIFGKMEDQDGDFLDNCVELLGGDEVRVWEP